jgi:putative addiction module component (TIGR02574 family)
MLQAHRQEACMSPATVQLLQSALSLPEDERLALAEALLFTSEHPPCPQPDPKWLDELQRRSAEIDAGVSILSTWAEVKQRVRQAHQDSNVG